MKYQLVMPGLVPGTHVLLRLGKPGGGGRGKPGHDVVERSVITALLHGIEALGLDDSGSWRRLEEGEQRLRGGRLLGVARDAAGERGRELNLRRQRADQL